ncbi:hypothetical protein [Paracoccus zhejiangensis]|uniref:Uncharacterized protein n=1 Tax=Paracoccus zhejiangensis TaxID=1077935 RepID=A0A2H5F190_9RHOB|nr:hypothetical protein [Paracoccus zhejiangensis]AUH65314.1 hypothetical protein CX676_15020 [Paracoccus zhejiangensis]
MSHGRLYANPEIYAIDKESCEVVHAASGNFAQNETRTPQLGWHAIDTRCSGDVLTENENPDAQAGAIGADLHSWFEWIENNTRRESAARVLARAVADCDPSNRLPFLEIMIEALRPGQPLPIFNAIMTEAREWAAWASRAELKAYCTTSFARLTPDDRAAFLSFAEVREVE